MIKRCHRPGYVLYPNYGGRGILVCEPWRTSFEAFMRDVGPAPPGHTIDRRDVNGGYEPGNVRWATRTVQARNTRRTIWIRWDGDRISFADAAERLGIPYRLLYHRMLGRSCPSAQEVVDGARLQMLLPGA